MIWEPDADLFKDAKTIMVEMAILEETYRDALALIKENNWDELEGLQIVFANGLYYLRGEKQLSGLGREREDVEREVQRLSAELIDMYSKYAVMKFRAYTLNEAKQTLEFNVTGLNTENRWSTARLKKFREDEEELRRELEALRTENERLRQRLLQFEGPAAELVTRGSRKPFLARLLDIFRKTNDGS